MLKKLRVYLLLLIFLFVSCAPVTNLPNIPEDDGQTTEQEQEQEQEKEKEGEDQEEQTPKPTEEKSNSIKLIYNEYGPNYQGYGPTVDQNLNFIKGYKCKINISLKSNVDIDELEILLVDTSKSANWWLQLARSKAVGITANSEYNSIVYCSITNEPKDINGVKIVLNTKEHEAIISDLQFSIILEENVIIYKDGEVRTTGKTYKIIEPHNQQLTEEIVQKFNGGNTTHYYIDASFIYNTLDEESKNSLKICDIVLVDAEFITYYDRTYYGIAFTAHNVIAISNNPDVWYEYSRPEQTLIHEMAHILSKEDHGVNWAKSVLYIMECFFKDRNKKQLYYMVNGIINRYNLQCINGEITSE